MLNYSPNASTTGGHSLIHPGINPISVKCTTLEKTISDNGIDRIDFLKLDCEGAELEILHECPPDVLRKVRRGAMEVNDKPAMSSFLTERGFQVYNGPKPNYFYFVAPS